MSPRFTAPKGRDSDREGVALIIVLAFVVLLTTLVVAYLSRTTTDRALARSSFDITSADLLGRSALEIIVADFKKEIADGGTPPSPSTNIVPQRSGNFGEIPNLIRRSHRSDAPPPPAVASFASAVNSTDDASLNGRAVSAARWNKHYLIPRRAAGIGESVTTVYTDPTASFVSPDWVVVTNLGPTVLTAPNSAVIGRYAYAVYDEGGLLDVNVAGFPSANSTDAGYLRTIGRKGVLAFADLTATGLSFDAVDNLIGWRNYSNASPGGSYSAFTFAANPTEFIRYFLETGGPTGADRSRNFGVVNTPAGYSSANPRTDQAITSRTELLALRKSLTFAQDAMQYLGTFSREINRPTWGTSGTVLAGRFPLNRFDLFTTTPPATANTGSIRKLFGLIYVPSAGSVAEHWQYVGTVGSAPLSAIPAVAGSKQDPDLFPLLQYALPTAPIGEILSIGASLIDQCDGNDETTWIEFASSDPSSPPKKAFGIDRAVSTEADAPPRPATVFVLNRAFRNVGELSYAYRNGSTSLDFRSAGSLDAPLLDLFTYNTANPRPGTVSLNTRNAGVLSAILRGAVSQDSTSSAASVTFVTQTAATNAAHRIVSDPALGTASNPAIGRAAVARLAAAGGPGVGASEEEQESVARALAEVGQTRTWGLLIDLVAQSGRYPPNAASAADLPKFVVQAEKRYWLHIALDRFTGQVIDQQLEAVYE
jgi:Tfp pilus assembly protein PilX